MAEKIEIRRKIKRLEELISSANPRLEHRDCPVENVEKSCLIGFCSMTESYIYKNTLDAAHEKLDLLKQLGKEAGNIRGFSVCNMCKNNEVLNYMALENK